MAKFNTVNTIKTTNKCGHVAYTMENKLKLTTMVLTTFFNEKKFYGDNSKELVELAKTVDPQYVAKLAIYARKTFHMRSVAHVLTAVVANRVDTKPYIKQVVSGVVERVDDITEIMACYINMFGKPIPNGLKKGLAAQFNKFNEYHFAKYEGAGKAVKLRDVMMIVHPRPQNKEQSELFKKILEGRLTTPITWETQLSTRGNIKEVWEELISNKSLGYMAQLRNLNNIIKSGAENIDAVLNNLKDKNAVMKSKQLPFRFYSAYKATVRDGLASSKIVDTLETALAESIKNISKLSGRTLIAVDSSGSMSSSISNKSDVRCTDIANLLGAIATHVCEDCVVVQFDRSIHNVPMSSLGSIIQNTDRFRNMGGGTDLHLPFEYALNNPNIKFDRIILISDCEINSCRGFEKTCQSDINKYHNKINPDLWVHAIDLQGYGTQQFIGKNTNIIAGWSEKVLEFISLAEQGVDTMVTKIESGVVL